MSSTLPTLPVARPLRWLRWSLPVLALAFAALGAHAQQAADPPGRVAAVTQRQGSVVFAPAGEEDWTELPANRPLTQADRLWTDAGGRAELHLGAQTVHVRDLTNLGVVELDDDVAHFSLSQGSVNAHVRALQPGERFEVGTPNVAVSASQASDWRLDVDPDTASTRVTVHSGTVTVRGEGSRQLVLGAGQDVMFVARDLEQVEPLRRASDAFDQWASARNQQQEQSQTAKYIPREVVGSPQLDNNGVWSQDITYGPVWYPNVTTVDWAPYRQGRWMWVQPWGWTWVDDAAWGFAPYHYGRWAMIGSRWAWVPAGIGRRPVYAPALVAFIGGSGSSIAFNLGASPAIGWYPLGPGEIWQPYYRASTLYVRNVNHNIHVRPHTTYANSRWVTAVRVDDFNRGRPVTSNWHRVDPSMVTRLNTTTTLPRPDWSRWQRPQAAMRPQFAQTAPLAQPLAERAQRGQGNVNPAVRQPQAQTQPQGTPQWRAEREQQWRAQLENQARQQQAQHERAQQQRLQQQSAQQPLVQQQVQPAVQQAPLQQAPVQQDRSARGRHPQAPEGSQWRGAQPQQAAPAAAVQVPQPQQVQRVNSPERHVMPQHSAANAAAAAQPPMAAAPQAAEAGQSRGQHRGWQRDDGSDGGAGRGGRGRD